jgi:hypothetical protein
MARNVQILWAFERPWEVDGMPEIGDIKPTQPTWGKRPIDRTGPDPRQPKAPVREKPRRKDDDKDDSRGGQIDEYA